MDDQQTYDKSRHYLKRVVAALNRQFAANEYKAKAELVRQTEQEVADRWFAPIFNLAIKGAPEVACILLVDFRAGWHNLGKNKFGVKNDYDRATIKRVIHCSGFQPVHNKMAGFSIDSDVERFARRIIREVIPDAIQATEKTMERLEEHEAGIKATEQVAKELEKLGFQASPHNDIEGGNFYTVKVNPAIDVQVYMGTISNIRLTTMPDGEKQKMNLIRTLVKQAK